MEYLSVDKKWTFSLILKYFYQLLFWYCALLCIPVCACAMSRAQKNAVNSFGKYFYVENVDNFTSVLIFLKRKGVIQSSLLVYTYNYTQKSSYGLSRDDSQFLKF